MPTSTQPIPLHQRIAAWLVHLLTASTAIVGLYTFVAIYHHHFILAFYLMGIAIFIDAIDGTLARYFHVKTAAAKIDGALLDNMVDYVNYVLTPCFLLLIATPLLPPIWREIIICAIILSSAYQFTQNDAKTADNFFKGFPCYWNLVVFYLFIFHTGPVLNMIILVLLCVLIFIPIKYVYPSRMDHLTNHLLVRRLMLALSVGYGIATAGLVWYYPVLPTALVAYSIGYIILYFGFSIYRTIKPLST